MVAVWSDAANLLFPHCVNVPFVEQKAKCFCKEKKKPVRTVLLDLRDKMVYVKCSMCNTSVRVCVCTHQAKVSTVCFCNNTSLANDNKEESQEVDALSGLSHALFYGSRSSLAAVELTIFLGFQAYLVKRQLLLLAARKSHTALNPQNQFFRW